MKNKIFVGALFIGIIFLLFNVPIIGFMADVLYTISKMMDALKKQVGGLTFVIMIICLFSMTGIVFCVLFAKIIDFAKRNQDVKKPLSESHPMINLIIAIFVLAIMASVSWAIMLKVYNFLVATVNIFIDWSTSVASKLDAVVIVALITGTVSLIGVIISSLVSKIMEYKRNREEYLNQKREEPYSEFVEMVYKVQQSEKNNSEYSEEMMTEDILKFSKKITLWGSTRVVKKWNKFREHVSISSNGIDYLFILEDIMNEMRRDLGLRKVKKGNLLAFFINDIKEVMKANKRT